MTGFDFSAFEKEAAQLLASMRATSERMASYESKVQGGRASTSEAGARGGIGARDQAATSEIKNRGMATEQLAAKQSQLEAATRASSDSERMMAQTMAGNSAATQKAGALNNEFVDSAKRGEVTLGEMGAQVAGTTAKFGGWIIAGSAVYFAAKALAALKLGAIEASSGVDLMSRVIDNIDAKKVEDEFQSLAGHFNLPIGEVTNAAFEAGRVFHNQNQAFAATKAILYGVKIGELDTAAATKYLASTIYAFHLPATYSQFTDIIDQATQAQRRFGVSTEEVLQGVAKAGAVFHEASGSYKGHGQDLSYLLALVTTGARVTGQPGSAVGTALARTPAFLLKPANQQVLRGFGIDPSGPIEHTINQAFERVKDLTGKQVNELASGLGGGVRGAKIFSGILSNYSKFKEIQKETSPAASKGSAQQELDKQLASVDEQIKKLGVSMERIGVGLANSHLLDSLGGMLKVINEMLSGVNLLVQGFSKLPAPIGQITAYLIQASVATRLLQRFQLGQTIAGGPGAQPGGVRGAGAAFFGEGERGVARRVRSQLVDEQDAYQKENARLGGQGQRAAFRETNLGEASKAANQNLLATTQRSGATAEEIAAAQQKQIATERAYLAAQEATIAIKADQAAASQRLEGVQTSLARSTGPMGRLNTRGAIAEAERTGMPLPAGYGKGAGGGAFRIGDQLLPSQQRELDTVKALQSRGIIPPAVEGEAQGLTTTSTATTGRLSGLGQKLTPLRGALSGTGSAMSNLGGKMGGLIGSAGTIIFGAFILSAALQVVEGAFKETEAALSDIEVASTSAKQQAERLQQYSHPHGETPGESYVGFAEFISPFGSNFLGTGESPYQKRVKEEFGKARQIAEEEKVQKFRGARGEAVPFRFTSDIDKDIEHVKDSGESRKKVREAIDRYEQEMEQSYEVVHPGKGSEASLKHTEELLNKARVESSSSRDLVQNLRLLPTKEIEAHLDAALSQSGGTLGAAFDPHAAQLATKAYEAIIEKIGTSTDPKSLLELAGARQKYFQGIQAAVAGDLQYALTFAQTPDARKAAFANALRRYQQFASSDRGEIGTQAAKLQELQKKRQELEDKQGEISGAGHGHGGVGSKVGPQTIATAKSLKAVEEEIKAETQELGELKKGEAEKKKYVHEIIQQLRVQEYEANSALAQARESAKEALTADPILQAQEQIKFLGAQVARAIAVFGKDSQQVFTLIQQQRQAQQQLVQAQLGLFQSKGNLEVAGITEAVPKEKATLYDAHGLEAQLRYLKAHANTVDPKTIIDMEAQVIQAHAQLTKSVEAEATALKDAAFKIREARATAAGEPIRAASEAVREARYNVAHAQTPLDKLNAEQALITAVTAKREAVNSARLETIHFEASMEKTTTQMEIEQLESFLATHKLTLAMRRQIRGEIHSLRGQLSSEGEKFDLNIGDMKLPTAYDIRRAVLGASGGKSATVNQSNTFHIANSSNDPSVMGRAIGNALGRSAESAARSAGVAT